MFFKHKKLTILLVLICIVLLSYGGLFLASRKNTNMVLGVTYDSTFASYLGLDWQKTFLTVVDDWKFQYIRITTHWDEIERTKGQYDFWRLDWLMQEAAKRNVKIILALGQKTPRWPECHVPTWAEKLSRADYDIALRKYVETVVGRYKENSAMEIWQVENEPFLPFGNKCVHLDKQSFALEVAAVKQLDPVHPTLVSDSGELSTWIRTARAADLFGTTMYRVVWNEYIGYWNYDWIPAAFYKLKLQLNGRLLHEAFITELQAEPWVPNGSVLNVPYAEQFKSMNLVRLQKNIDYAQKTGLPRAYLWGAEWWAWLESKGQPEIANYIRNLEKNNP